MSAPAPFTVYMLHFERRLGRVRHYVGVTRTDRLAARLREHAMRRGSRVTAALAKRNERLLLVRVWPARTPDYERKVKNQSRYNQRCPVCRSGEPSTAICAVPCPSLPEIHESPLYVALRPVRDD